MTRRPAPSRPGRIGASALAAVLLFGCGSDGQTRPEWTDPAVAGWAPLTDPTTVIDAGAWRLEVGDDPNDGTPRPCLQVVLADAPLGCITVGAENDSWYGFHAQARAGGERLVWRAGTADGEAVHRYVVWSSASPNGRTLEPVVYEDVENLIWLMAPGEEPWGYQAIAADGSLIEHTALVGLPGE